MTSRTNRWCGLIAAVALLSVSPAFAADPEKPAPSEPRPEVRQQMAAAHQKMADCLRSERPVAECKSEMMKSCHDHGMMGTGGCPMMGTSGGGMGPGTMGGGMMKSEPPKEEPKK